MNKTNTFNWNNSVLLILVLLTGIVVSCTHSDQLDLAGTLERRTLEVSAPISEIILDLPIKVGDQVKKGSIIVQLDTEVAVAELRAFNAALAAAKALLKEAVGEFNRQAKLRKAKFASAQAYDSAKRKKDEAFALVTEKEARITQAKKRLRDLTIQARADGYLDQLPYEVGERAPAGGVVAVIIGNENPWVRVWLPARDVTKVNLGQKASIKIEGLDEWFDGVVEYISREPEFTPHYALTEKESAHLVFETKVRLTNPKKDLPAGVPAHVLIPLGDAPAPTEKKDEKKAKGIKRVW
ncbi:MAG: efflux RND transporter periplasmic adaptor subunit [bacterium]|nr:efflux RND transporter periplasmic adaptor subunit [bacterium]